MHESLGLKLVLLPEPPYQVVFAQALRSFHLLCLPIAMAEAWLTATVFPIPGVNFPEQGANIAGIHRLPCYR